jgi:hypothetical protein
VLNDPVVVFAGFDAGAVFPRRLLALRHPLWYHCPAWTIGQTDPKGLKQTEGIEK